MTMAPEVDVRDLKSVRRAAVARGEDVGTRHSGDIALGEDYISPEVASDRDLQARRSRRGMLRLNRSPLARKIITFNLLAMIILVAGVLYMNSSRDNLAFQRANGLVSEAVLIADVFEAKLPVGAPVNLVTGDGIDPVETLAGLNLRGGVEVYVYDTAGNLVSSSEGMARVNASPITGLDDEISGTIITDFLNRVWDGMSGLFSPKEPETAAADHEALANMLVADAVAGATLVDSGTTANGQTVFTVVTPILQNGTAVGAVALTSAAGELDRLVRHEREQVLQMFVIGILVSIGLSLALGLDHCESACGSGGGSRSWDAIKTPVR